MTSSIPTSVRGLAALVVAAFLTLLIPAIAHAAPDPFQRGPYKTASADPLVLGTVNLQEPSGTGGGLTGVSSAVTLQVRGSTFYPTTTTKPAPLIIFVHGNHGSCDFGSAPACTMFKRNDRGYAYMAENLATWGYNVVSLDQDQMIAYQDGTARGMHNRRILIAALLDGLYEANQRAIPDGPNSNIGSRFVGKIDFSRIGMMGHSRGGDVVTSYLDYNRTRPAPGRRYDIRGVIALAPTDFERRAPYGTAWMAVQPTCDGDVTSQHGSRMFERGQVIMPGDPFPKIQTWVQGANHNWFNTVWRADGDDSTTADAACGNPSTIATIPSSSATGTPPFADMDPTIAPSTTTVRLSGNAYRGAYPPSERGSADPARMGDQQRIGLATMNTFLRRYVGGETAFDPYMTGELSQDGVTPAFAPQACPTSATGTRIACKDRVKLNYYAGATERKDVIGPQADSPLTTTALGTALTGSGFANPFQASGGVSPLPATTAGGYDWCNPETPHYTASAVGSTDLLGYKACPQPGTGQAGASTTTPVNRSYGLQLALAWDNPVVATGEPAKLTTKIPAADGDVTAFKALTMAAAVNYFDSRNPDRGVLGSWNPAAAPQDFTIALTDASGKEGTVAAGSPRYGTSLQQTIGSITNRTHVMLDGLRVPLSDFAAQGVDLSKVRKLELRFGETGKPASGSIQLADIGFQELVSGPTALTDTSAAIGGGGAVTDAAGPDPMTFIEKTDRIAETKDNPEPIGVDGANAVATQTSACADTKAPTTVITSPLKLRGKLVISGIATDPGCAKLATVQVGIYKPVTAKVCRAVQANGKLGPKRPCSTAPTLVAKGAKTWKLALKRKLPKGTYKVLVRAIDSAGNATSTKLKTLVVS